MSTKYKRANSLEKRINYRNARIAYWKTKSKEEKSQFMRKVRKGSK